MHTVLPEAFLLVCVEMIDCLCTLGSLLFPIAAAGPLNVSGILSLSNYSFLQQSV